MTINKGNCSICKGAQYIKHMCYEKYIFKNLEHTFNGETPWTYVNINLIQALNIKERNKYSKQMFEANTLYCRNYFFFSIANDQTK